MNFNQHLNLQGTHAFLSASNYHWIRYSDEKLATVFKNSVAAARGTALHDFACSAIRLNQKLPKSKKTLNMYVNDAIGYRMIPEQILYFSDNCYGTADTITDLPIIFKDGLLRIHDLKTGTTTASMEQLEIYAALFCLEYKCSPGDLKMELRIYQNDQIIFFEPTASDIAPIMDRIIRFDKIIEKLKEEWN